MKGNWFDVDRKGLRDLVAGRGPEFVLYELVQNAWDEDVTEVSIKLNRTGTRRYTLIVTDDSPDGFRSLADAWTLYASSYKKDKADKRGRFNVGEKLVLALANYAVIETTTGTVAFGEAGRTTKRTGTQRGTIFTAEFNWTKAEVEALRAAAFKLISPPGINTTFTADGSTFRLRTREPVKVANTTLATVLDDGDGVLRPTRRKTDVEIIEVRNGETPTVYEMGIPVVELPGDKYHVNVLQKVPLNTDRDNVTPSYLRALRVLVLNEMHREMDEDDAQAAWVSDASGDKNITDDAVTAVVTKRFGEKSVAYDPSDPEANKIAMSKGYTVIPGRSLPRDTWNNVRRAQDNGASIARPAGRVTPSPKVLSSPDGVPPLRNLKPKHEKLINYSRRIMTALLGFTPSVTLYSSMTLNFAGAYGGRALSLNIAKMGRAWSEFEDNPTALLSLLIHEAAHEYESDHFSHKYLDAATRLGASLAIAAAANPDLLEVI